jgi:hypothetical protein
MATHLLEGRANLFDVLTLKAPNNSAVGVTNTLVETNDLIKDLPALPSNGGLFHQGARVSSLPSGTLVDVGDTWASSKSERTPFVEALATLRSRFQSPRDVLQTEGPEVSQMLVSEEKKDHVEGMGQSWVNLVMQGSSTPQQNSIVGLMNRAPWNAIDSEYCYDTGGTSVLRSAWLIQPGPATVHLIYNPNHPTLGIEMEDMGKVFVQEFGTDVSPANLQAVEGRWDIIIEFMIQQGICIRDQRAVKRIANVPCGATDTPGADLINNVIRASLKHNVNSNKMWFLYCDADLYTQLVLGANDKLKVYMSDQNIYQTKLPMIGPNVIIRRMDALNYTSSTGETEVV